MGPKPHMENCTTPITVSSGEARFLKRKMGGHPPFDPRREKNRGKKGKPDQPRNLVWGGIGGQLQNAHPYFSWISWEKPKSRDKGRPVRLFRPSADSLKNWVWMPESEEAMDENCHRIILLLDLYRAGKVTESQKADVEYHLLYCPECIFLLTLVPSLNPE